MTEEKQPCEHCVPNAKEPDIRCYESGKMISKVSMGDNDLHFENYSFQPDGNEFGYYCNGSGCQRNLKRKEIFEILEKKKEE